MILCKAEASTALHLVYVVCLSIVLFLHQTFTIYSGFHSPGQEYVLQLCCSSQAPTQYLPLWAGAGFVQVLVLILVPPSHIKEHSLHSPNSLHPPSTGQCCSIQSWVSVPGPWQSAPPWAGAGFVQVLVLVWVPCPHAAEHSLQSVQSAQPPLTETILSHKWTRNW